MEITLKIRRQQKHFDQKRGHENKLLEPREQVSRLKILSTLPLYLDLKSMYLGKSKSTDFFLQLIILTKKGIGLAPSFGARCDICFSSVKINQIFLFGSVNVKLETLKH